MVSSIQQVAGNAESTASSIEQISSSIEQMGNPSKEWQAMLKVRQDRLRKPRRNTGDCSVNPAVRKCREYGKFHRANIIFHRANG